jgi:hypothetical protein
MKLYGLHTNILTGILNKAMQAPAKVDPAHESGSRSPILKLFESLN